MLVSQDLTRTSTIGGEDHVLRLPFEQKVLETRSIRRHCDLLKFSLQSSLSKATPRLETIKPRRLSCQILVAPVTVTQRDSAMICSCARPERFAMTTKRTVTFYNVLHILSIFIYFYHMLCYLWNPLHINSYIYIYISKWSSIQNIDVCLVK